MRVDSLLFALADERNTSAECRKNSAAQDRAALLQQAAGEARAEQLLRLPGLGPDALSRPNGGR